MLYVTYNTDSDNDNNSSSNIVVSMCVVSSSLSWLAQLPNTAQSCTTSIFEADTFAKYVERPSLTYLPAMQQTDTSQ